MSWSDTAYSSDSSDDSSRGLLSDRDCAEEPPPSLWSRSIVHLDVDCFYCQCEEIDGPPDFNERPIAIGQKHIVVTCNYIARREGVKKLQCRIEAMRKCPNLLIIEGSDLERYRQHSRRIYNTFRQTLDKFRKDLSTTGWQNVLQISACKGGMDEMYADLTDTIEVIRKRNSKEARMPPHTYIYGSETSFHETSVSITEDQSGASTLIARLPLEEHPLSVNGHAFGNSIERLACKNRLEIAGALAERLRRSIQEQTGFTTTMGVSVSPMLAKLGCIKKPDSLNVLYPWRSSSIILPMPLRKVPLLGHRTLEVLTECLKREHPGKSDRQFWNCRDLLQVPRYSILAALSQIKSNDKSSQDHCDMLLQRCRGIDETLIIDDNGGIPKTVSVENSFRRGTITSKDAVTKVMKNLFERLPRLLVERRYSSDDPELAFPNTIRMTARLVDNTIEKRRPFVTKSKQCNFDGKTFMNSSGLAQREGHIRSAVAPLLESLVCGIQEKEINVTKLNIAVTNFSDLQRELDRRGHTAHTITHFLTGPKFTTVPIHRSHHGTQPKISPKKRIHDGKIEEQCMLSPKADYKHKSVASSTHKLPEKAMVHSYPEMIDPAFLDELPPDVAEEIRKHFSEQKRPRPDSAVTIDKFFKRKK